MEYAIKSTRCSTILSRNSNTSLCLIYLLFYIKHLFLFSKKAKISMITTVVSRKFRIMKNLIIISFFSRPNYVKQKNAFPPNYVHSLDSTHMMLTALQCARNGITFVSVHDSFWTHACDVDQLSRYCREQFVSLHKEPLLEILSRDFLSKYEFKSR